jgi:hypothetical protein
MVIEPTRESDTIRDPEQPTPSGSLNVDSAPAERTAERRIDEIPPEVGAMLVSVGTLGVVLPGMAGAPALVVGGLVLWPSAFGRVDRWLRERFPDTHRQGMTQVARYLDDLERRFPETRKPTTPRA